MANDVDCKSRAGKDAAGTLMRICILTTKDHIYANFLIKKILKHFNSDEFFIVESDALLQGHNKIGALLKYLRISGVRYVFSQIVKYKFSDILRIVLRFLRAKDHAFYPYKFLNFTNLKNIRTTANINNLEFLSWISREVKPDLILSIYFNQILKSWTIDQLGQGVYNLHPALLPAYRGVSPTFWALANGEEDAGITLHKIVVKIDAGEIFGQTTVRILNSDTEHSLYSRCTEAGFDLLVNFIKDLKLGIIPIPIKISAPETSYFSLPTKEAMGEFLTRGRKLWKFRELIGEK